MNIGKWLLGAPFEAAGKYFTARMEARELRRRMVLELEKAKFEGKLAALREGRQLDAAWEIESIRNSGWKDEYLTILLGLPIISAFIKPLQDDVLQGFYIIDKMPDWYIFTWAVVVGSAFGVRPVINFMRRTLVKKETP